MKTSKPKPNTVGEPVESASDRFGWSDLGQIRPLHGDGTPYTANEVEALKAYHRQRAAERPAPVDPDDEKKC